MQQSLPLLSSEQVLYRFGLRLGVLLLLTALQAVLGYETAFFELVALFAGACTMLAILTREQPLAPTLSHWDEACGFGLIACLG